MYPLPQISPITQMRNRQNELLAQLQQGPILLTQHSRPAAMLIDPAQWNQLMAELEILSDSVAALEAKIELLLGQDDTISVAAFEAELEQCTGLRSSAA